MKQCKCEHWQQCPVCMPHRFDAEGNVLPPEPTPLQAARDEVARLTAELETERMRLAACGVVAMSNTRESAEKQRQMLPEYMSGSCKDVMRAVDAEMDYRVQVAKLEAELAAEKEISAAVTFDRERLTAELAHMQTMQKVDQRVFEKLKETQDLAEHWAIAAEQRRVELGECRKDAERLDWLLCRVSGKEYRRIGIEYSAGCLRSDIDAAMEAKP